MELMKLVEADIFANCLILEVWQSFEYAWICENWSSVSNIPEYAWVLNTSEYAWIHSESYKHLTERFAKINIVVNYFC